MTRGAFTEILRSFGREVGLDDLALDETGYCCLFFDDVAVNMELDEPAAKLFLYANVGELPPEPRKKDVYKMLLEDPWDDPVMGTVALGVSREHNLIALVSAVDLADLDNEGFQRMLKGYIEGVERWKTKIRNASLGNENPEDGPEGSFGGPVGIRA